MQTQIPTQTTVHNNDAHTNTTEAAIETEATAQETAPAEPWSPPAHTAQEDNGDSGDRTDPDGPAAQQARLREQNPCECPRGDSGICFVAWRRSTNRRS